MYPFQVDRDETPQPKREDINIGKFVGISPRKRHKIGNVLSECVIVWWASVVFGL